MRVYTCIVTLWKWTWGQIQLRCLNDIAHSLVHIGNWKLRLMLRVMVVVGGAYTSLASAPAPISIPTPTYLFNSRLVLIIVLFNNPYKIATHLYTSSVLDPLFCPSRADNSCQLQRFRTRIRIRIRCRTLSKRTISRCWQYSIYMREHDFWLF